MKKLVYWMFAAILVCGVSVVMTSCSKDEENVSAANKEYSVKCVFELVTRGDIDDKTVSNLQTYFGSIKRTNKFTGYFDAKSATDDVTENLVKDIKEKEIYAEGTKYIVYVKLFDAQQSEVYQRVVTVDGLDISVK